MKRKTKYAELYYWFETVSVKNPSNRKALSDSETTHLQRLHLRNFEKGNLPLLYELNQALVVILPRVNHAFRGNQSAERKKNFRHLIG